MCNGVINFFVTCHQISHQPLAVWCLPAIQTHLWWFHGKGHVKLKSWWATTLRTVLWGAKLGSHATTNQLKAQGIRAHTV